MGRFVHPLSRENRARILRRLQNAADGGSVAAGEALVRLSLIKEAASKEQRSATAGHAGMDVP